MVNSKYLPRLREMGLGSSIFYTCMKCISSSNAFKGGEECVEFRESSKTSRTVVNFGEDSDEYCDYPGGFKIHFNTAELGFQM